MAQLDYGWGLYQFEGIKGRRPRPTELEKLKSLTISVFQTVTVKEAIEMVEDCPIVACDSNYNYNAKEDEVTLT